MPPSTLSLVYFLDISLVGYCGAFPFQRTLGYLCLRKFSRHRSHQSNHHLRIFLRYFLKQLVAWSPIARWIGEVSGVRIIFPYTVDAWTGSDKLEQLSHSLDYWGNNRKKYKDWWHWPYKYDRVATGKFIQSLTHLTRVILVWTLLISIN